MTETKSYFKHVKNRFKLKYYISYFIIIFFIILFSILSVSGNVKKSTYILLEQIGYSMIVALSLSLLIGFLGELSLGHAGFMSIGAFTGGYLQTYVFDKIFNLPPVISIALAIVIGGLVAGLFGFIIGLPALRLKGDYLAIVTLAFGEIIKVIIQNTDFLGGTRGLQTYRYSQKSLFIIIFVVLLLTIIVVQNLIKSKHGRAVMAIRDNEIAAKAMGVDVTYYKLLVFVISAVFAGVAGVLFSNSQYRIESVTFNYSYSIEILVMVVLGGMGNINGTLLSAALLTFLNIKLANVLTGNMAAFQSLFYALILIVVVIYNNSNRFKTFREKYNLKNLIKYIKNKLSLLFTNKPLKEDLSEDKEFAADWSKITSKIEMDEVVSTKLSKKGRGGTPNE